MKRLNSKGMEKINEISSKYKFRSFVEIEQDEVYEFCNAILQAQQLGLDLEEEDKDFILYVREGMCE